MNEWQGLLNSNADKHRRQKDDMDNTTNVLPLHPKSVEIMDRKKEEKTERKKNNSVVTIIQYCSRSGMNNR